MSRPVKTQSAAGEPVPKDVSAAYRSIVQPAGPPEQRALDEIEKQLQSMAVARR